MASTLAGRTTLFTLGSRDGSRPGVAEGLLFEPGEYLLGLARAGGGGAYRPPVDSARFGALDELGTPDSGTTEDENADGYRLAIEEGSPYPSSSPKIENTNEEQALAVRPGRGLSAYATSDESWFSFSLNARDAGNRWDLVARVPVGRKGVLELSDAQGGSTCDRRFEQQGGMRIPDLSLDPGDYRVRLRSEADSIYTLVLEQAGLRVEGEEAEPNDQWALANRVDLGGAGADLGQLPAQGRPGLLLLRAGRGRGRISAWRSRSRLSRGRRTRSACSIARGGTCSAGPATVTSASAGWCWHPEATVCTSAAVPRAWPMCFAWSRTVCTIPRWRPNPTTRRYATSVPSNRRIKGTLDKDDIDFIRFDLSEEAQLWRFQVVGDGIHEVAYHDGSGRRAQVVRAASGQRRVVLDNLFLLPGSPLHRRQRSRRG
jgi:hypothetical protein